MYKEKKREGQCLEVSLLNSLSSNDFNFNVDLTNASKKAHTCLEQYLGRSYVLYKGQGFSAERGTKKCLYLSEKDAFTIPLIVKRRTAFNN